jgi:hypothetical protein
MMKSKLLQQGFSLLIAILIAATLAIIGFVAWRVYDSTMQANMNLDKAEEVSDSQQIPQTPNGDKQTKKLVIPGVEYSISASEGLSDLKASLEAHDGVVYAKLTTATLESLDRECKADNTPLGVIAKAPGRYENRVVKNIGSLIKQYDDYFIAYTGPQAACSDKESVVKLSESLLKDINNSLGYVGPGQYLPAD